MDRNEKELIIQKINQILQYYFIRVVLDIVLVSKDHK